MITSHVYPASLLLLVLVGSNVLSAQTPDNPPTLARDQALALAGQTRCQEAYPALVPLVRANPDDAEVRLAAAECAAELGRTYEAAELLMPLDENDPEVQLLWGRLLIDKRDAEGAIATLEPLLADPPAELEPEARRLLAWAYLGAGQPDHAAQLLEGKVGDDPRTAVMLARARYESGDAAGAVALLEPFADEALVVLDVVGEGPAPVAALEVIYEYGHQLVSTGRHQEAIPFFEAAVGRSPNCKPCWQQLAQSYAATGRAEEAKAAQSRFQEIAAAQESAAVRDRQRAEAQRDPTVGVLREAIKLYKAGEVEEALARLRSESQLHPEDSRLPLLAAGFLLELGRPADALELANLGVQLAPDLANGYFVRGTIRMALGDKAQAESDLEKALELDPNHSSAAARLDELRGGG